MNQSSRKKIFLPAVFIFLPALLVTAYYASAFTGPGGPAGIGSGAIGVDSSNNLSIGTSTTQSNTKLLIVASSTDTFNFAFKILQPNSNPIFVVRNDGFIGIGTSSPAYTLDVAGNVRITGTFTGTYSGTVNASNVTAGVFGAGNFAFPSSLGIATSTQVGLPQSLSVYGGGYFSSNVGIGTANAGAMLDVAGQVKITGGAPGAGKVLTSDATGLATWQPSAGGLNGSGTVNYVGKFTGTGTIGNSLIFDNGTNVGIGTTNPNFNGLEIVKSNGLDTQLGLTSYGGPVASVIIGKYARGTVASPSAIVNSDIILSLEGSGYGTTGFSVPQSFLQLHSTSGTTWTDSAQGTWIRFLTTPSNSTVSVERMRITEAGNVGIGTTDPVAPLSFTNVVGEKISLFDGAASRYGIDVRAAELRIYAGAVAGFMTFGKYDETTFTEQMRITNAGKVGIGTTQPSSTLHVAGASSTIRIGTGGSLPGCLEVYDKTNSSTLMYIYSDNGLLVNTSTRPLFCM